MGREEKMLPTAEVVRFIDDAEAPDLDSHGSSLAMEKERVDHVLRLIYLDDGIPDATDDSVTSLRRLRLSSVHDIALLTGVDIEDRMFPNGDDPDVILSRRRLEAIHKYLTSGKNSFTTTTTMEMIVRANQDYDATTTMEVMVRANQDNDANQNANCCTTLAVVVIFMMFFWFLHSIA
jgi:hypothetical protein